VTLVLLPQDATPLAGPVHYPDFPGVYYPGEPVDVDMDADRAREAIEELGLPLVVVGEERRSVSETLRDLAGADVGALRAALESERSSSAPRRTLIAELERRIAAAADSEAEHTYEPAVVEPGEDEEE
jgi:hypothetical protein